MRVVNNVQVAGCGSKCAHLFWQSVSGVNMMDNFAAAGQAGFVANMSDIAPRYAGRLFGLANTFGSFAGILGVSAVGFVVEKTGSFDPVFKLTAVMYIAATVVWNLMCTGERVFE